jgi:dTDP-4-amino-4,6-dideoxygalactose transaminase
VQDSFALSRDALYSALKAQGVHARRYFYPLISEFPMYRGLPSANPAGLPHARRASSQVICLPIYPALSADDVARVVNIILDASAGVVAPAALEMPCVSMAA